MKMTMEIEVVRWSSPLGEMILGATQDGLAGLWFDGQRHQPDMRGWRENPAHPVLRETIAQLRDYFSGKRRHFELPLDLRHGTAFQQSVWAALRDIPCGGTSSYAAIGQRIGKPAASRAVGAAVGRNPLSIVVPCHRVLGSAGQLTGYAGGLHRKSALLRLEGALM